MFDEIPGIDLQIVESRWVAELNSTSRNYIVSANATIIGLKNCPPVINGNPVWS